ncbi:MAG: glutamate-5-semialdehyde dehydrogenase [Verrucomicrobiales bacterium]|nr:glutamate-5-semialdehyde dehydrogenase [Verrucomicrobiales bacterium]|tara:strand:- start:6443 stop:7723 length:1281 start_codon:yes stop_codon:yes gene_type:complete
MNLTEQMTQLAQRAKSAARDLNRLSTEEKNRCLSAMADAIEMQAELIQSENEKDLATGEKMGLSKAMLDRLELTDARIAGMAQGLREVAELNDPTGRVLDERERPNGLQLQKVTVPIGVILIIYESRPNVTADAASLCLKSGNAVILRGGKEAIHSNQVIAKIMVESAQAAVENFPDDAITVVPTTDREAVPILLSLTEYIDLCMPRGGEGLIRAVAEASRIPVIKHYKGVCHVYVDGDADAQMGVDIAVNSKCHRPGVCNAAETLLVDRAIAGDYLPQAGKAFAENDVELRVDAESKEILSQLNGGLRMEDATDEDWGEEYLDLVLSVGVVDGVNGAIEHINEHGSGHSDAIVTNSEDKARRFLAEVDTSAAYWNASTRFTDGGQFGMGAEIGISTDKIGARGPMGLDELTTYKWQIVGTGQIRE